MPPRRTRGSSCQSVVIRLVWAVGVPLAVLLQLVKHAPAVGIPILLAAAAGGVVYVVRRARNAEQQRIEAAHLAQIREVQSREIARYHALGPTEFEHAIAYLCQRDGCTNVQVVGGAGDLGADVTATAPDGRRLVIQCKRYGPTNKVSSPDMQRFGGTCYSIHGAHIAALVTTSTFTRQATAYAVAQGIRLYDEQTSPVGRRRPARPPGTTSASQPRSCPETPPLVAAAVRAGALRRVGGSSSSRRGSRR